MNKKVTIVTQAYNASKFIHRCIKSVVNQSYSNIDYLLIDDGSTDGTSDIIEFYAKKDSRIKCIFCEDNSKNVARWIDIIQDMELNDGYFMLLDSDDWLEYDCIERLIKIAEDGDYDIVGTGSIFHDSESNKVIRLIGTDEQKNIKKNNIIDYIFSNFFYMQFWWGKLYKIDMIKSTSLERLIDQTHGVTSYIIDIAFALEQYSRSNCICIDNSFLHNYRVSTYSTSKNYEHDRFNHPEIMFEICLKLVEKFPVEDSERMKLPYEVFVETVNSLLYLLPQTALTSSQQLHELYKIFNLDHFQEIYDHIEYSFIEDSRKNFVIFANNCNKSSENSQEYNEILMYFVQDICQIYNIDANQFLDDYNYSYFLVKKKKYDEALEYMTNVLIKNNSNNKDFLNLYISVAAIQNRVNEFIFGKVKLAKYYASNNKYSDCKMILDELTDMGVEDDEEISELRKIVQKL